jgi:GT2 family glycosyltransferase
MGASDPDIIATEFLPLYCAICPRNLFQKIGGFIKPYPYAMYEDEELAYRMKHYGFKQAISGKSWVHHDWGATISAIIKKRPDAKKVMEANYEKCLADIKKLSRKG